MRTSEAIHLGIHPRTLYAMRDAGDLERLSRGLYRLAEMPPLGNPDLTTVALRVPKGVICLISALSFHDLTTQIPHYIYLALLRGTEAPRVDYPALRLYFERKPVKVDELMHYAAVCRLSKVMRPYVEALL